MDAGAADAGTTDLAAGVAGAAVVVLCAPVGVLPALIRRAWPHLASGAVLTDAGSVKQGVVAAAEACPARASVSFVGGHPMAGSERSGLEASDPDLFEGRIALLTPTARTPPAAVAAVTALWEGLGSTVRSLPADAHDRLVAQISHVPHLVAYALVAAAEGDALLVAGRGFVDATRIAASAEGLWSDIFRQNRDALLDALARVEAVLGRWRDLAVRGDFTTLEAELGRAREVREKLA
jgi:prephenate dehydrogenase